VIKKLTIAALLLVSLSMAASPPRWADLLSDGIRLKNSGLYLEAIAAFQKALALAEAEGVSGLPLMQIYDRLGTSCAEAGQAIEAAQHYRQALGLLAKIEGRQSLDYALVLGKIALLPGQGTSNEQAIAVLQQALRSTPPSGDQSQAVARKLLVAQSSLAQILIRANRLPEAEQVLLQLTPALVTGAGEKEMLGDSLVELGMIRFHQRRYSEAADYYRQSLQVHEEADGIGHPHLIRPLNNLATAYARAGRFDDACPIYQRAISLCAKTLGENQLIYGILLQNYGDVLKKLGRKHEGESLRFQGNFIQKAFLRRNGAQTTIGIEALRSR